MEFILEASSQCFFKKRLILALVDEPVEYKGWFILIMIYVSTKMKTIIFLCLLFALSFSLISESLV